MNYEPSRLVIGEENRHGRYSCLFYLSSDREKIDLSESETQSDDWRESQKRSPILFGPTGMNKVEFHFIGPTGMNNGKFLFFLVQPEWIN